MSQEPDCRRIDDPRQADLLDQREAAAQSFVAWFLGVPVDRVTALKLTGAQ